MGASIHLADLKQQLADLHELNQLNHAYLFTSYDGNTLKQLVHDFIGILALKGSNTLADSHLLQRITSDQFADAMYIYAEGQTLKVDQIRALREWLSSSPVESRFKVGIIADAALMNQAAANALLTFLEEPVDNVYLILLAPDTTTLLATVLSRVQHYHIQTLNREMQVSKLVDQGIQRQHAELILDIAADDISRLTDQYQSEVMDEWLHNLNHFYHSLLKKDLASFVQIQTHLKPYLSMQGSIDCLNYLLLCNYKTIETVLESTEASQTMRLPLNIAQVDSNQADVAYCFRVNTCLLETKQLILANVSPQLAFEDLVVQLILD